MATMTSTAASGTEETGREQTVTVNGVRLHYLAWGEDDGPGVLLLHGLTGNAWEWTDIGTGLADRCRVVALNQRGHGASGWAGDYAPDRMVEDIAAVVDALGLAPVRLVGHSMGGIHAYLFAARHPELVDQLVIVDIGPGVGTDDMKEHWRGALTAMAAATYAEPAAAIAEWQAADPLAQEPALWRFIVHNLHQTEDGRWRWRFDAAGLVSWVDQWPDAATEWAAVRRLACPTLLIRGAASPVLSAETAARMLRELAAGELVELAGGAHDLTVERPAELAREVREFVTG